MGFSSYFFSLLINPENLRLNGNKFSEYQIIEHLDTVANVAFFKS